MSMARLHVSEEILPMNLPGQVTRGAGSDVEVVWDEMPEGRRDGSRPLFERIEDMQRSLLRRVAKGVVACPMQQMRGTL